MIDWNGEAYGRIKNAPQLNSNEKRAMEAQLFPIRPSWFHLGGPPVSPDQPGAAGTNPAKGEK